MSSRSFASDNNSGVHPLILEALNKANSGHVIGYGNDKYTKQAEIIFKEEFGQSSEVFFMLTGTGANVLSIDTINRPFNAVICADTAHIYEDECGAPERFTGCKLLPVETENGKLSPDLIQQHLTKIDFEHHVQPNMVSISQVTELGTVYSTDELKNLCDFAHKNKLLVHMDGARISNAAAALNKNFRDITTNAGIDILSFGGTKNGMMCGEAVVVLNTSLLNGLKYRRKQSMQLYSKMRFVSAQFIAYFENDLWRKNAEHANKMAAMLFDELKGISQLKFTQPVDSNALFVVIPKEIIPILQEKHFFYIWNEFSGEVRWMTSFDTTQEDVKSFAKSIKKYC